MNQMPIYPAAVYGKDYYDHMCAVPYERDQSTWRKHFLTLARTLADRYHPAKVLDVGCAKGFLVEHLRDLGVEAFGVDISPYAISQVREDVRSCCRVAGGNEPLEGQYDLITCIEVAEHMPEAEARAMIEEMCRHTDQVIFSSSPDDTEEPTHINLHPADYWTDLFQKQGFFPDFGFDPGFIAPQALRFLRGKKRTLDVAVFSHEPPNCAVALLRLAGTIRRLEREDRMRLRWCTARDPQVSVNELLDSDLFVLHREFCDRRFAPQIMAAARELKKPVVFELDDLLINVPESNPNHKYCQAITPDVMHMLREADYITVTTEPLRRYLEEAEVQARGKIHVLPNYINLEIWDGAKPPPEKPSDPFVIGWFGTATHDEDLAIIKPAIVNIARRFGGRVVFKFWGYLPKDLEGIPGVQLVRGSQPDLRLHARDLVNSRIDLALAPLLDHPFNHAKSDLKWLEYAICYIPGIYSTISPYTASVTHGKTGWLVDNNTAAWTEAIERFINDHALRRSVALQAYDEVRRTRCVEVGAERWDALYRSFHAGGRRPRPTAPENAASARQRAGAHILFYQSEALFGKGQGEKAIALSNEAVSCFAADDSAIATAIKGVVTRYRTALKGLQQQAEISTLLKSAEIVAAAGVNSEAVRIYLDALQTAQKLDEPQRVFKVILEVAKAFHALDPERGRQLVELSAKLAGATRSPEGLQAVEALRTQYSRKASPAKQTAHAKKNGTAKAAVAVQPATSAPDAAGPNPQSAIRNPQSLMGTPLVSIVIPVFNQLAFTKGCLNSIAATPASVSSEIIVVDNASTDGTTEFLAEQEKAGRIRVIGNSANAGFARACNQGAAVAQGKYVLFLNNDTEVKPGWLEALTRTAEADPRVGAVSSKLLFPDGTIQHAGVVLLDDRKHGDPLLAQHIFHRKPQETPEANQPMLYQALTAACLLVRKELFREISGFDEEYWNGYEDVDLCFKIRAAGRLLVYQPASVVVHFESQSGPERFRSAPQNIARLHQKWLQRVQPDYVLDAAGQITRAETNGISAYTLPMEPSPAERCVASIIILAFNQLAHTQKCLESIAAHTPEAHEVIVVDNGSTDGTAQFLKQWQAAHANVKVICNSTNRGFAAGNNQGLSLARGEQVVLLNNDTVVTRGWLAGLVKVVVAHPETGLVGPMSNSVSGPQLVPNAGYQELSTMPAFAAEWARTHQDQSEESGRVVGFCLLARRELIERIGGLDEQFGSGNFEDDDFCIRARLAGYRIRIAKGVFIHHTGSQTFKGERIDYRQAMLRNWDRFRAKWQLPADTVLERGYPIPNALPEGVALKLPLSSLGLTHKPGGDRTWLEETKAEPAARTVERPSVARLGNLDEARTRFGRRDLPGAWNAALAAIQIRPFHPEAHLLLAEIALAAGDSNAARQCAQHARDLAPRWKAPKQFLQKPLNGNTTPDWLRFADSRSPIANSQPANRNRLTVCVIARNEERFLAQCLKSVKGIAQQIIVVDTGSTDRTVEIARAHGAEVFAFAWCDDFSAARNAALEQATGDWILVLDADEELTSDQHARLQTDLKKAETIAYRLPLTNAGQEDGFSYVPRLFRNAPGVYYYGRIHEQVFPSLMPLCKAWGLAMRLGTTQLLHHGYSKEIVKDRQKNERNLRLLKLAVAEHPNDPNLLMNLGLELVRSGDLPAGLGYYRESFRRMSAQAPVEVVPELREALLTQLTCHLYKVREHDEIIRALNSPLAQNGGLTASLHFALGLAQFELKQYEEAAEQMRQCVAKRKQIALSPINTDILTSAPNHCLALSLAQSGDTSGAAKAFDAALAEKGRTEDVKLDYAKFLAKKNPVDALHKLHEIVVQNAKNAAAWRFGGELALKGPEYLEFGCDWTSEAIRYLPDDLVIVAQRAEALLLSQQTAEAKPLWERTCNGARPPHALAALILCAAVESQPVPRTNNPSEEILTSKAFVGWYQRLLEANARETILRLNSQVDALKESLPTAAGLLLSAMEEANQTVGTP